MKYMLRHFSKNNLHGRLEQLMQLFNYSWVTQQFHNALFITALKSIQSIKHCCT